MIKKIILSIIALSALLVGQKAYWVDVTNGNDSNDGSSENQAFKTIQYFTSSVNWADGDTLYVKPSEDGSGSLTYYDFGNNEANINSSNDLVIIGTGGRDRTIFDAESKNRHFVKNGNGDLTIRGITFQNGKVTNSMGGSIDLMGNGKTTFMDVTWKNNVAEESNFGGAISIFDWCNVDITGNMILSNRAESKNDGGGIFLALWASANVHNNVFVDNFSQ